MSEFKDFASRINAQWNEMQNKGNLFKVGISKQSMWDTYLQAFPEGTNPIFRERTEHDCSCCHHFINVMGNVVRINENYEYDTIWDCFEDLEYPYNEVAYAMKELINTGNVANIFLHDEKKVGTIFNRAELGGRVYRFHHFHAKINEEYLVKPDEKGPKLSFAEGRYSVAFYSLSFISPEACETVLDLIAANNLYRGQEFKKLVENFLKLKKEYDKLDPDQIDLFAWTNREKAAIRNTVIGTLLTDLSTGVPLDKAVIAYESKVAPENYKRPKAIVSTGMIKEAKKTIEKLGLEPSLYRRPATISDISVNDILFVDKQDSGKLKDGIDKILDELPTKKRATTTIKGAKKISIEDFIKNVLPRAKTLEVLVNNNHFNNFMVLTAGKYEDAEPLFHWGNPFAWTYTGNLADSMIKERVVKAGGNVNTDLRISLAWFNKDDLDLHLQSNVDREVFYGRMKNKFAHLDVDMNAGGRLTNKPVENIYFSKLPNGRYVINIHNYHERFKTDKGFSVEIEGPNISTIINCDKSPRDMGLIRAATFEIRNKKVVNFKVGGSCYETNQEKWGIYSNEFAPVSMFMLSPNYWESGNKKGNKHYFFILKDARPDETIRGFFNEFLRPDLQKHRKVFEVLASKMECEPTDDALAGIGFSETKPGSIIVKINNYQTQEVII